MSAQQPSKGRIVVFVDRGFDEHAAVITKITDRGLVNLTVFPEDGGVAFQREIPYAMKEDTESGLQQNTWHWPPRV